MKTLKTLILLIFVLSVFSPFLPSDAAAKKAHVKQGKRIVHVKKTKAKAKAKDKEKAERKTEWRKSLSGSVYVTSHRAADIYFDNDIIGKAPISVENVKPGKHLVEAYIGNELIFRRYVEVKTLTGETVEINGKKDVAEEDPDFII